jgi:hypothetical protein
MALITTTKGDMDDSLLERKDGSIDNDIEFTTWTEYWLGEELVHRSVHVHLKTTPSLFAETAPLV